MSQDVRSAVQLQKLVMDEVSGVDDPANEIPGHMVMKAADFLAIGEEMEAFTKASDSNQPYGDVEYADPGYQSDGKKRYPLDTEKHIRAAWSYINQAKNASAYSSEDLAKIKARISAAMKKIGADVSGDGEKTAKGLIEKIRGLLGSHQTPEGDLDMTSEELAAVLDERLAPVAEKVEELSKAVADEAEARKAAATEEPAVETPTAPASEEAPALTAEDVAKAIEEQVVAPYNEILEKVMDRIEGIEKALADGSRLSLQSNDETVETTKASHSGIGSAVAKALATPSNVRVVERAAAAE